ncbi:MAG TPA: tetratricopeptide repeat protein [Candidatus Melainabacteria bacterium]|jgi:tetratricopeptide (TPR) repeat protein|nr:tetratricopeptide repeat protein [Candidatus Melainabacteria bacterium]HIN64337.1 tetratricopeptide repeat protein [Candidatus Obscuribacterales bacterium]
MKLRPVFIVLAATVSISFAGSGSAIGRALLQNDLALSAGANAKAAPASASPAAKSQAFQNGVSLFNAKRFDEASAYFTNVVKSEPTNAEAYYYLATCQAMVGDEPAAKRLYEYVVKYFPDTPAGASSKQYLDAHATLNAKAAEANAATTQKQMKQLVSTIEGLKKSATTAPASLNSLVEVVRARADRPNVSAEAVAAIKGAVDKLPPSVKNFLWTHGVRIYVTPTVEDYSPGVKYQEARGYEGGTYKSCPAFYHNRKIVIAERTMDEGDESIRDAFPPNSMVNSLYHETGHAMDFCLDGISHSDEFKHAYLLDSAHVEPSVANTLKYYLQKSEDGQEECCAELIGLLLGQTERHTTEMRATFPLTLKLLKAKLGL